MASFIDFDCVSVDNTLLDLQNSSNPTQPRSIIAKYLCALPCFFFFQTLASAEGNILENKVLLESLNKTKASSMTIAESLQDAHRIQTTLDQVRINLCQVIYFQKITFCLFKKSSAR